MSEDTLRIMCPSLTCRRLLAVPVSSRGKNVRCRNCGATIRVPDRPPAPAAKPEGEKQGAGADKGADKPESAAA